MKELDAINTVGREALITRFSWVRYVTGLSTGSFTLLIAFHKSFENSPVWALKLCFCFLFLTTILGTFLLLRESAAYQRLLGRLVVANSKSDIHPDLIETVAIPTFDRIEKIIFPIFYMSFLSSMGSLLIYALLSTKPA